ncbi:Transcription initiation protein spt3 [Peltigera leucophlebia]|nr:Transcription initiation protein spt3 [Peltigera leucophlebia]
MVLPKLDRNITRGLLVDNPVFYLYDCKYEILKNTASALKDMKDTTLDEWVPNVLTHAIRQMMFVSGETADASVETTVMIEEIVHAQVVEMLRRATEGAARRGSRSISVNDLFFLIRHDKAKLSRLMTFLSWKEVRKTAKDSDEKGGDAADIGAGDDPLGGGEAAAAGAGPAIPDTTKKTKWTRVTLPWDVSSYFNEQVPEREDDDEVEEEEMNSATVLRLKVADERTKHMTKDEYVHYSECRQASFTFRKAKRFREWAGFGIVTDSKPNDDIVDILGFLLFEIVQTLTEEALKVKGEEDLNKSRNGTVDTQKKHKRETGLFDPPEEGSTPVGPKHIQEAFRRLQERPIPGRGARVWMGGPRALHRTELKLI